MISVWLSSVFICATSSFHGQPHAFPRSILAKDSTSPLSLFSTFTIFLLTEFSFGHRRGCHRFQRTALFVLREARSILVKDGILSRPLFLTWTTIFLSSMPLYRKEPKRVLDHWNLKSFLVLVDQRHWNWGTRALSCLSSTLRPVWSNYWVPMVHNWELIQ